MDRGAQRATVHRIAKSQTRLSMHALKEKELFCFPDWTLIDTVT